VQAHLMGTITFLPISISLSSDVASHLTKRNKR
jgi:hypothetical protein